MSAWGMLVGTESTVGCEGAVQDVSSMKIVRRIEVHVSFILAPFETKDTQTSKVSMSTKTDAVKENIQCVFQYVLRRVGQTGGMCDRRYTADEQSRSKRGIHFAEDPFADAFVNEGTNHILVCMPLILYLFLARSFQSL